MNEGRGGLLTAGGVLSIIVGAFEVLGGGMMLALTAIGCFPVGMRLCAALASPAALLAPETFPGGICVSPVWWLVLGGLIVILGIIAIAGGVSAVKRRSFSLSLAGAICALPSVFLGLLALIFIAISRDEFEV
jgi:hypothetical protein